MTITADTWAVVAATGLGPIIAVIITLGFTYWREAHSSKYRRRLNVFRTLMSTRRLQISNDHVNALNLIEVDFYGCKGVEIEWRAYIAHLNDNSRPADETWQKTKDKLLSKLLFEIAKVLNYDIQAIEIFEGGYAPQGWAHRDALYTGALTYVRELRDGSKHFPLWVHGVTPPPVQNSPSPPSPRQAMEVSD